MTDLDLDAIQARADAATPGPWHLDDEHIGVWTSAVDAPGGAICEPSDPYPRGLNHPLENMRFVTHARQDIPALVAEVRRLRDQLAYEERNQDFIWAHLKQLIADERLTEDLEDLIKEDSYLHGLMDAHSDKVAGRKWGDPE